MPQINIFRWPVGRGWLVLAGGRSDDPSAPIEAKMLYHTVSQGPLVYIWAASDIETADRHMDTLRDLGARTGYLLDVMAESDDDLFKHLSEAGIIILGDGPKADILHAALSGVILRALEEAFTRGATIYAFGNSAPLLGAYVIRGDKLVAGANWLANAIVMPGYTPDQAETLRGWIQQMPDNYGLGLGSGAALALGPGGAVEVWGDPAVTVSLGQNLTPPSDS